MKKVIHNLVFGSIFLSVVGCTQPLQQCVSYYKDKPTELKKCIHNSVNDELGQIGKSFEGGNIVNKKQSIQSPTGVHQDTSTGVHQDAPTGVHQDAPTGVYQDTSTGVYQDTSTGVYQDTSTGVHQDASTGVYQDTSTGVYQDTSTGVYQDTSTGVYQDTSTGVHQDASTGVYQDTSTGVYQDTSTGVYQDTSSIAYQQKNIISDINIMCNSLQQNYEKFKASTVESRALDKARRTYQECKKEQEALRQESK